MRDSTPPYDPGAAITRREALRRTTFSALAVATGGCLHSTGPGTGGDGRLTTRAATPTTTTSPGLYPLGFGRTRDGFLYVPTSYKADTPAPLALLLHGAGQEASELLTPMRPLADTAGLVLLAVDSRDRTWDAILGAFSADVQFIDRALAHAFSRVRIDATRVRIAGFSDGASYSLTLGIINGDLFSRVAAFSPGFIVNGPLNGKPKIFVTHGTRDTILPIDQTSRQLVPALKNAGYDVEYHEFDGGHGVPPTLLPQATTWLATGD
jgi:phospholipase/carboxylesterase